MAEAGQPLEELVEIQALGVDLREAVIACLSGGESRCWTVAELVERFKNLGICATRASVTAALAELALELEISNWAPWRLLERGTEWILAPKSELLELLSGVRRLALKEAKILSEEHKAVLLVVIGYRQKGGVSKTRVGEALSPGMPETQRDSETWFLDCQVPQKHFAALDFEGGFWPFSRRSSGRRRA